MNELDAHLLVVDDDERIRSLLKKFLKIRKVSNSSHYCENENPV